MRRQPDGREPERLPGSRMGESLTNLFFRPYIYKSWAYPPEKMTHEWIKRRIPQMGVEEMVGILLDDKEEEKEGEGLILIFIKNIIK